MSHPKQYPPAGYNCGRVITRRFVWNAANNINKYILINHFKNQLTSASNSKSTSLKVYA